MLLIQKFWTLQVSMTIARLGTPFVRPTLIVRACIFSAIKPENPAIAALCQWLNSFRWLNLLPRARFLSCQSQRVMKFRLIASFSGWLVMIASTPSCKIMVSQWLFVINSPRVHTLKGAVYDPSFGTNSLQSASTSWYGFSQFQFSEVSTINIELYRGKNIV